jgi:alanine racemase
MTLRSTTALTVDLSAIQNNFRLIAAKVGASCQVVSVVKADCYGLGMAEIAPALESAGCDFFYVAHIEEGLSLRKLTDKKIAVLNPLTADMIPEYKTEKLIPVLNSPEEVVLWADSGPAIWHVDTGMNRLGMRPEDAVQRVKNFPRPMMLMTHFACSDENAHPLNAEQVTLFDKVAADFPGIPQSLCNSSAIFRGKGWHRDQVRPGIALYGGNPVPERGNPMSPVVNLKARILQVRYAKARETVGYGASATLMRDSVLGTVGIGYADGLFRSVSGKSFFYWQSVPFPVLGRVSMDLSVVDLTDFPDGQRPQTGDWLEVLGPSQSADQLAGAAGTISYEVLTSLGPRCAKAYLK